jgi:hypothetical protein
VRSLESEIQGVAHEVTIEVEEQFLPTLATIPPRGVARLIGDDERVYAVLRWDDFELLLQRAEVKMKP